MNKILTFKMWEDAAANSVGAGGIDGIGVGAKGEPGVHMKKKKKKEQELLKKMKVRQSEKYAAGSRGAADGWEKRTKTQQNLRKGMWSALGKKLKRRK